MIKTKPPFTYKFQLDEKVWIDICDNPTQVVIEGYDRNRSWYAQRYIVITANGRRFSAYEDRLAETKEELCHKRMGRLYEEIAEIEANCKEEIAKKIATIQRWEVFMKEARDGKD